MFKLAQKATMAQTVKGKKNKPFISLALSVTDISKHSLTERYADRQEAGYGRYRTE